jgi:hypothetical protein
MIRTTLKEKERSLAQRKAELGIEGTSYVAANPGTLRTEAKRELLRVIDLEAQARGVAPRFRAAIG